MSGAALVALGTLLVIAAWWMLARAMPPAQRGALDVDPQRRRKLRIAAPVLLLASLACFVGAIGIEQGPVFWTCVLMLGAMGVALLSSRAAGSRRR
jgi:hypothetical protein